MLENKLQWNTIYTKPIIRRRRKLFRSYRLSKNAEPLNCSNESGNEFYSTHVMVLKNGEIVYFMQPLATKSERERMANIIRVFQDVLLQDFKWRNFQHPISSTVVKYTISEVTIHRKMLQSMSSWWHLKAILTAPTINTTKIWEIIFVALQCFQ